MAEGGKEPTLPYLNCYEDTLPTPKIPLIMIIDEHGTKKERIDDDIPFPETRSSCDNSPSHELPVNATKSYRTVSVLGLNAFKTANVFAYGESCSIKFERKTASCPNLHYAGPGEYSGGDKTGKSTRGSTKKGSKAEPVLQDKEAGAPKRRSRRYSKKDYLLRRRTKPVVHSPYPSPTSEMVTDEDGDSVEQMWSKAAEKEREGRGGEGEQ